jgi:hypothetical protein
MCGTDEKVSKSCKKPYFSSKTSTKTVEMLIQNLKPDTNRVILYYKRLSFVKTYEKQQKTTVLPLRSFVDVWV